MDLVCRPLQWVDEGVSRGLTLLEISEALCGEIKPVKSVFACKIEEISP